MKYKFAHNNLNVVDLEKSLNFYEEALGLKKLTVSHRKTAVLLLCILGMAKQSIFLN